MEHTITEYKAILEAYIQGFTVENIAKYFKTSIHEIYKILNKWKPTKTND